MKNLNIHRPGCFFGRAHWYLNNMVNLSVGLEHLTITEKVKNVPGPPSWTGFGEDGITQGFISICPGLVFKFANKSFEIGLSTRLGTANFIGNSNARYSSYSLANGDLGFEIKSSILFLNNISIETKWIHGTTKYGIDHSLYSYWKYHTFLASISYLFDAKK